MEDRALLLARCQRDDRDRRVKLGALRDLDEDAVAHQRGVEHQAGIAVGHARSRQDAGQILAVETSASLSGWIATPSGRPSSVESSGAKTPSTSTSRTPSSFSAASRARTAGVTVAAVASGLASRSSRADRYSARIRAGDAAGPWPRSRRRHPRAACARRRRPAVQPWPIGELGNERLLGRRLERCDDGHHAASA
jgi:hypothetical protein